MKSSCRINPPSLFCHQRLLTLKPQVQSKALSSAADENSYFLTGFKNDRKRMEVEVGLHITKEYILRNKSICVFTSLVELSLKYVPIPWEKLRFCDP